MSFPTLNIGDLIAKTPIVQGGMGVGISLSRLASAVANEGGIGVIAGAMIGMKEPDVASNPLEANLRALRREIEKAREATQGIIGVNIMVALTTFAEMVRTSIEAKADVIFSGAGLPMDLPKIFNETCERKKEEFKTKLVPIISSGRAATLIARKWMASTGYMPDAFVVEGPKAGGHLGFSPEHIVDPNYALEQLVPQVVEAVKPLEDKAGRAIPVIAESSVASVKWRGGWVCRSTTSPFSHSNSSPFATTGSGVPSFSSSRSLLPNSVRQPASARKRALATNLPLAMSSSITHLRNTASGQNCIRY